LILVFDLTDLSLRRFLLDYVALEQVLMSTSVSSRQYNSPIIPSLFLTYTILIPEGHNATPVYLAMLFWKPEGIG
jgi:hypothetical protein